ncbi:hypothetical protein ACI8AF_26955 [Blastococcus sp. SYSU D00669]
MTLPHPPVRRRDTDAGPSGAVAVRAEHEAHDATGPIDRPPTGRPEPAANRRTPASRIRGVGAVLERARRHAFPPDDGDDRGPAPARVLFALAATFYVVHQLLTHGRMILGGSMWAEMGTNYYVAATSGSLREQLFTPDAGYLPLPQRLIGLLGAELGVPAWSVPYFYTGSALVLSGLLLGSVCLPAFRQVIASDWLRFLLALALVLVPEFQTRTYINFTYFAVVFAAMVTALALVSRDRQVPRYAWLLPLLLVSKPGVLAVLPAMVVVALVSGRRFRLVVLASLVGAAVQGLRLATSVTTGSSLLQDTDAGLATKVYATLKYFFGLLGRLLLGPAQTLGPLPWMLIGLVVVLATVAAAVFLRSRGTGLALIGISLVLFTMLINAFTFSAVFTPDLNMLGIAGFDRRYVVGVFGLFFVVAGLIAALVESPRTAAVVQRLPRRVGGAALRRVGAVLAAASFALWFVSAHWHSYSATVNQPFGPPVADVSQWTEMAPSLAAGDPVVCVPLDPFGWMYGRDCEVLDAAGVTPMWWGWAELPDEVDGQPAVTVETPDGVREGRLASVALMVRPDPGLRQVTGTAVLTTGHGETTELSAAAEVGPSGGLLQFTSRPVDPITDVESVTFVLDQTATVGSAAPEDATTAIVLWMGQPGE